MSMWQTEKILSRAPWCAHSHCLTTHTSIFMQKPGVTQLGLPKTFCPFPQGSNQSLTDGCVGQEIVSLAKASWLRETFFAVGVPKGRRGPDNIRIHLYSPPFMPWFTSLSPLQALSETSPRGSQSLHRNPQAFLPGHLGRVRRSFQE